MSHIRRKRPALMSFPTTGSLGMYHHSQLAIMLSLAFNVSMTQLKITPRAGVSVKVKASWGTSHAILQINKALMLEYLV